MNERQNITQGAQNPMEQVDIAYELAKNRGRAQGNRGNQLGAARHSVLRNPKSYISFILALLLIQTLLCVLLSAAALDVKNTESEIYANYDYDILLRELTQPQYAALHNLEMEIPDEFIGTEVVPYTAFRYEKTENGGYNVYITLRGEDVEQEASQLQEAFLNTVAAVNGSLVVTYSPRYNYPAYLSRLHTQAGVSIFLLLALATCLLVMLQRTRLNHEKYQYGIYMAFGAGYHQLFTTAAGELLFIILLTTVPSLLLGNLATALLCIGTGKGWSFSFYTLLAPVLTGVITWISVRFPVKHLSTRTPTELLTAKDNSNLVSSPRRSLRIFGRSFPFTYELFSLWRYRRYLAGLMLFTMLFASLWLGLVRIADFNTAKENTPAPEYTVTFNPSVPDADILNTNVEELSATIEELDGVAYCSYIIQRHILDNRSFMAVSADAARRAGSYTVHSRDVTGKAHPYATTAVRYVAYNEDSIRRLVERSDHIEGNPYEVLTDDRSVILSTALNNTPRFSFAPGDTVLLATNLMTQMTEVMTANNLDLLRMMLAEEEFHLEEYTVCAVIHDERSDELLTCGVNHATYTALTELPAYTTSLQVYLEDGTDFEAIRVIDEGVQSAAANYYSTAVLSHNDMFSRYLDSFRNLSARIITAAYFLLAMMPLFSFFSQRVFYEKREREWFILKTLGGQRRERGLLLLVSGLILTVANFVAMLPLGLLADYLAFKLCNEWLPAGGFLASALMHYELSAIVIPVLLFFALLCGFAPCLIEYVHVRRAMKKEDEIEGILAAERAEYAANHKEDNADVSEKN